jgi:hypothetical protein
MRAWIPLALAAALSGCAAHRTQVAHKPDPLYDWASVLAIPPGTSVRAELAYNSVRQGDLDDVTDSTLTIRMTSTMNPGWLTIDRARVVRVEARRPKKTRWGWLEKPLAVGMVGGLAGTVVGAVMRDAKVTGMSLGILAGCAVGGFVHLLYHWDNYEFRVVYVRP